MEFSVLESKVVRLKIKKPPSLAVFWNFVSEFVLLLREPTFRYSTAVGLESLNQK
jgi:hypothetical protein